MNRLRIIFPSVISRFLKLFSEVFITLKYICK
nr:MAG TPA: hypothetical protein [Bacteriophage sp.]